MLVIFCRLPCETGVHKIQLRAGGTTPLGSSRRRYACVCVCAANPPLIPSLAIFQQREQTAAQLACFNFTILISFSLSH